MIWQDHRIISFSISIFGLFQRPSLRVFEMHALERDLRESSHISITSCDWLARLFHSSSSNVNTLAPISMAITPRRYRIAGQAMIGCLRKWPDAQMPRCPDAQIIAKLAKEGTALFAEAGGSTTGSNGYEALRFTRLPRNPPLLST